jgi:hypothetical protein
VDGKVSRRGTCDRGIWRKPLAFAADAVGYIYIVWGFNGRFAISSLVAIDLEGDVKFQAMLTADSAET